MERPIARDVKGDAVRPWLRHLGSYAWALAGLAVVLLVATAALAVVNRQVVVPDEEPWDARLVWAVLSIPAPVIGALISSRRRDNPYGWVWLVMGLGLALQLYMSEYVFLSLHRPGVPLVGVAGILSGVGWATAYFSLPLVLLLYPTGHPPSGRWNVLLRGILLTAATTIGFGVFSPTEGVSPVRNPIQATGVLGGAVETVVAVGTVLVLGSTVPAAVSLVARYRSAGPTERAQLKWFLFAAVVFVVSLIVDFFWELEGVGEALKEGLVMAFLPVAVAVAILRHRLYDIDRIVSRTVSYAVVTALLVGVYVMGVFLLQRVVPASSDLAVAASTLAAAAAFNPIRRRVQSAVDRRFNRARYDAVRTVEQFSERVRIAADATDLTTELQRVAASVMEPAHLSVWLGGHR
ncbi:MAG TPA: hypothetical protein VF377_05740 [Acidimicrobiia bacterium]|jgi:hypothetical protein